MKKILSGLLAALLAVVPLSAAEPLATVTVAAADTAARIHFHRRGHAVAASFSATHFGQAPGPGTGHLVDGAAAPDSIYFEYQMTPYRKLPEFTRADFRVKVYLPARHPARDVNLRLVDADGETFQFRRRVDELAEGWHELVYAVDATQTQKERWGGGDKANGRLDMPVRFRGLTVDYAAAPGVVGIGSVTCDLRDTDSPAEISLLTGEGSPVHVLKAGEEGRLSLAFRNPRGKELNGAYRWRLTGVRGEPRGEGDGRLALAPGERTELRLPPPDRFGVHRVTVTVADDDPAIRPVDKEMRYAYMIPAGPAAKRSDGFIFGVCSHPQRHAREDQRLEAMAAAWCGVMAMRTDVEWQRMQPAPDRWAFESFDQAVAAFGEYGIEVMPILSYCAGWAKDKDWKPLKPQFNPNARPDYDHWRAFVRRFAERHRDRFRYVEVWNEPDLYMFANFPEDEYVRMLEIAYGEIKRTAPAWQVLCGGFASLPHNAAPLNPKVMPAVIRSGRYDVFAFHGHGLFGTYRDQLEKLPSFGNAKPWFANETAVSSMVHGEEVQARTLFRKLIHSWAKGSIGYNWYDLRNDGFNPANNEHNFGLVTADFFPKPAYAAYNTLARLYRGAAFLREVALGKDLRGYLFRAPDDALLLAAWSDAGDGRTLPVVVAGVDGEAEAVDLYGQAQPLEAVDRSLLFDVGPEPATLRITGQRGEVRVLGAMVRPQGELAIAPGDAAEFRFDIGNFSDRERTVALRLDLPDGLTAKDTRQTFRLAPGATRTLVLPVRAAKSFRSLPGDWKLLAIRADKNTYRYRVGSIAPIPVGAFPDEPSFRLEDSGQVVSLVANAPDTAHRFWRGKEDLSAQVRLARDADALRLRIDVVDDKHVQPHTGVDVWQGDNIQFALKIPGQKDFWEFGLTRTAGGGGEVFVWRAPDPDAAARTAQAVTLNTARDETKRQTRYEARIPFDAIGLTEKTGKEGFRFNLLVNDNDGSGRKQFIHIAPGIGESKDDTLFPPVRFAP